MSSTDTQGLIDQTQRDIEAYEKEVQSAQANEKEELVPGLQQKIDEKRNQMSDLQVKVNQQRDEEQKKAQEEAYEEGKDDAKFKLF